MNLLIPTEAVRNPVLSDTAAQYLPIVSTKASAGSLKINDRRCNPPLLSFGKEGATFSLHIRV